MNEDRCGRRGLVHARRPIVVWFVLLVACRLESACGQEPDPVPPSGDAAASEDGVAEDPDVFFEQDEEADDSGLTDLSLEDLMDIEVTSVSKKAERRSRSAAAIYVVTADEIRQAGARTIPEMLRLVPGVEVAQITRGRWAVSARGFNNEFANKLLVLMDGRTLYTPLFSGTFWNQQDTLVEDIERIEVIRGPGATLWGANAVNGIINIITKHASRTTGGQLKTVVGSHDRELSFRYGAALGEDTFLRAYAKLFDRPGFEAGNDRETHTDWMAVQTGFRLDSDLTESDSLTVQGDYYDSETGQESALTVPLPPAFSLLVNDEVHDRGANIVARWEHELAEEQRISLQFYWDYTRRDDLFIRDQRHTLDLDFQHQFSLGDHELVWGTSFRYVADNTDQTTFAFRFDPANRDYSTVGAFIQDEWKLVGDELSLIAGTKVSRNTFTGFELQPSARLRWSPDADNTVWAAVSRAVRTASRAGHDIRVVEDPVTVPMVGPLFPVLRGNDRVDSEVLIAYELGWRTSPTDDLSLDLALFYNDYDDLRSVEPAGAPGFDPVLGIPTAPQVFGNGNEGVTYGAELAVHWRVTDEFRVRASYSAINVEIDAHGLDASPETPEGESPHHRFQIRPSWDVTESMQLNAAVFYTEGVPTQGARSYWRVDFQILWHPIEDLEFGFGVRNLLDDRHTEWGTSGDVGRAATDVERTFYAWLEWSF